MPRVVHFDISADEPERAIKFYKKVFGWKIEKYKDNGMDYWLIMTGEPDQPGIDGGLAKRQKPSDTITNFIDVPSVDDFASKIQSNGGQIVQPKMTIPSVGYIVICKDTEGNIFGIIEFNELALAAMAKKGANW